MPQEWLTRTWGETLEDDIELLLGDLCVGWGLCNGSVCGRDLLSDGGGRVAAGSVAEATMKAEGDVDPRWRDAIERLFQYRYGARWIAEADFPPASAPYSVAPDLPEAVPAQEDPVLLLARKWAAAFDGTAAEAASPLDTEAVMDSIRRVRGGKCRAVGPEEHEAARQDLAALIVAHERLTGRFWSRDPVVRLKLGLAPALGTPARPG